jgi:hypothetical protein
MFTLRSVPQRNRTRSAPGPSAHAYESHAHTSIGVQDVDARALMQELALMDPVELTRRRVKYNMIYKELAMSCDQQERISFSVALKVLCYHLIDIDKSLKIGEELFERKQRVERVREAIAREKIRGLFYTIVRRRQFMATKERQTTGKKPGACIRPNRVCAYMFRGLCRTRAADCGAARGVDDPAGHGSAVCVEHGGPGSPDAVQQPGPPTQPRQLDRVQHDVSVAHDDQPRRVYTR